MGKIQVVIKPNGNVEARSMTFTTTGWKQLAFTVKADTNKDVLMGDVIAAAVTGLLATRDEVQAGASKAGRG